VGSEDPVPAFRYNRARQAHVKVLVIGGTRFIGAAAVRVLRARGHEVAVFHRGRHRADLPAGVAAFRGDREDLRACAAPLRAWRPDVVLHNICLSEAHAEDLVRVFRGVVHGVVMTSSIDVYRAYGRLSGTEPGPPDPVPLSETSPLRTTRYPYRSPGLDPADPRHRYDKILAEQVLLEEPAFPATILRLPMVIGPGDFQHRLFPLLRPMLDRRPALVLQEDHAHWRCSHAFVDNVAEALALACEARDMANCPFDVIDASLSTLELAGLVAKAEGWKGELVLVPRSRMPGPLAVAHRLEQPLVFVGERIRRHLGYCEAVPLEEAIRRTVGWERVNPPQPLPARFRDYAAEDALLRRLGAA
jgi:nucleoside-diphosphate-sugar epimerase